MTRETTCEPFHLATQELTYQPSTVDRERCPDSLFFQQGMHLDVPEIEAILSMNFSILIVLTIFLIKS